MSIGLSSSIVLASWMMMNTDEKRSSLQPSQQRKCSNADDHTHITTSHHTSIVIRLFSLLWLKKQLNFRYQTCSSFPLSVFHTLYIIIIVVAVVVVVVCVLPHLPISCLLLSSSSHFAHRYNIIPYIHLLSIHHICAHYDLKHTMNFNYSRSLHLNCFHRLLYDNNRYHHSASFSYSYSLPSKQSLLRLSSSSSLPTSYYNYQHHHNFSTRTNSTKRSNSTSTNSNKPDANTSSTNTSNPRGDNPDNSKISIDLNVDNKIITLSYDDRTTAESIIRQIYKQINENNNDDENENNHHMNRNVTSLL